jgi:6-phosphogluconolactonase (cycloisomerase 2 family)
MAGERLRIVNGAGAGRQISLDDDFVVGRGERGAGNLDGDPEISRRHARFRRTRGGQVVVEDLGSAHGTYVGGERLSGPRVLLPGDTITVGWTVLQLDAPPQVAAAASAPPFGGVVPTTPPAPPDVPPPPQPAFPWPAEDAALGLPRHITTVAERRLRALVLAAVLVLSIVAAVVGIGGGNGGKKSRTAVGSVPAPECGANIGKDGPVAFIAYVQSNVAAPGRNSVIAMPFRAGDMKPLATAECPTGGSGSGDPTASGALDAGDKLIVNPETTLLFAANQGSDTIAVFHIDPNGGLRRAPGSPFPSNGKAPSSLAISGKTLVVANKAHDGTRDLANVAPNYTTLSVGTGGRLTAVAGSSIGADSGSSPTSASVPARGGVAFGTEESGPIRSFSVSSEGLLTQAPGSPYDPPAQAFPPGFDGSKKFALGMAAHPKQNLVYMGLPTIPALAVYSFDPASGELAFVSSTAIQGAHPPRWIQITKDGHWLYTSNADTNSVTVFDVSNATRPKQVQTLAYRTPGSPWNIALDPTDKFLFGIAPRAAGTVPEGEGNTIHVMSIGSDGKLTEPKAASPSKIPVPKSGSPQGIAVITPGP